MVKRTSIIVQEKEKKKKNLNVIEDYMYVCSLFSGYTRKKSDEEFRKTARWTSTIRDGGLYSCREIRPAIELY